jgi:hypothetical protein
VQLGDIGRRVEDVAHQHAIVIGRRAFGFFVLFEERRVIFSSAKLTYLSMDRSRLCTGLCSDSETQTEQSCPKLSFVSILLS